MNYHINPDTQIDYKKLKDDFNRLKKIESNVNNSEYNLILSNNKYSSGIVKFMNEHKNYIGKNVKIFLYINNDKKEEIIKIIGPVFLIDSDKIFTIIDYIINFYPRDSNEIIETNNLIDEFFNSTPISSDTKIIYYD